MVVLRVPRDGIQETDKTRPSSSWSLTWTLQNPTIKTIIQFYKYLHIDVLKFINICVRLSEMTYKKIYGFYSSYFNCRKNRKYKDTKIYAWYIQSNLSM